MREIDGIEVCCLALQNHGDSLLLSTSSLPPALVVPPSLRMHVVCLCVVSELAVTLELY